jgi:outer membrane immunogenic protein
MHRLIIIGVVAYSGLTVSAQAADLRGEDAPAVYESAHIWTGLYAGGSIGYGWGDVSHEFSATSPFGEFFDTDSDELSGGIYGAHLGYNFQHGNVLFGAELGINGAAMDGATFSGSVEHDVDWYATAVARLGYAHGQLLFYGLGGLAWGKVASVSLGGDAVSGDTDHVGWTAGAGVEYALSDHLSLRLEYAHVDLGTETLEFSGAIEGGTFTVRDDIGIEFDVIKIGASYRLGGGD